MNKFAVGDIVRQTPESGYLPSLAADSQFTVIDINPNGGTYPIGARGGPEAISYLFREDEIELVPRPTLREGDRVTVTLTGEVVGRGLRFTSIRIDGNEIPDTGMFGQERLVYIWNENQEVKIEKVD